jgi:elongation factor 2
MVRFTPEDVRALMSRPEQVRNMTVIAHVDHGKSSLTDSLVAAAGIMKPELAGEVCIMDTLQAEKDRGITIKSTAISMYYHVGPEVVAELPDGQRHFLVNLIDSPGHVDFNSEVTAALRVTDGALVVVDCVEGVCVQTETVLRQALAERIRPVLMVNKMDRAIVELQLDPESAYQAFLSTLQNVNVIIATYNDPAMGDLQVCPQKGTVVFGSGLMSWAFSVPQFARMYASKFSVEEAKMLERLWGDSYFDAKNKRWLHSDTVPETAERLKRGFCQYCLEPVYQLFDAVLHEKTEKLEKMLESLKIKVTSEERQRPPKKLLKAIMQRFLPAADALLQMIVTHLPSPVRAQSYRAEMLYNGPADDKYCSAIRACDQSGPLIMYVSKMVPTTDMTRFFAFGRVFSGTIRTGHKVRVLGANYQVGSTADVFEKKSVQRTVLMMGRDQESVTDVPAGNVVGLVGLDSYITKTATVTDEDEKACCGLHGMKYSVSPVVRVAVDTEDPADLPKLVEGLKRLAKTDSVVQCTREESGEHVVSGAGELHLEICLRDLEDRLVNGAKLRISKPVVSYRETVTALSSQTCLAKSPNRHNRLFGRALPLTEELAQEMEKGECGAHVDGKVRSRVLVEKYGWDSSDARRVWCFGPDNSGPNVVVDVTKGVQNMGELRDPVTQAWEWASKEGPLCGESLRGVRLNIEDVIMHADTIHRGSGQIIPTARRLTYASVLTADPRLMEPMFLVEIQSVQSAISGIYNVLSRRRGIVIGEENRVGTPIYTVKAHLPVAESFGITGALRESTSGQAFPQMVFDHWQVYSGGSPLQEGTAAWDLVRSIRQRKGLSVAIPDLSEYLDKL